MPDDRFENRLRAIAQQLSRSISDVDLDDVADRLGVDRDRVRGAADAAQDWLSDRTAAAEPLFGQTAPPPSAYEPSVTPAGSSPQQRRGSGPHPLDLPSDLQGRALSALGSGRWTLRPGSGRISGTGVGPEPPEDGDLTGELRARDWISADGAPTLVGRQALLRWSATVAEPGPETQPESETEPDAPTDH
jgi:hypothetical protein